MDEHDPFRLADLLDDACKMIDALAVRHARDYLQPRVQEAFARPGTAGRQCREVIRAFGQAGLIAPALSSSHGGADAGYVAYGLVNRAVEAVDSGYRSLLSVQSSLVIHPVAVFGTAAQRETYLPALLTGEKLGAFGLTEPEAGSDPGAMKTVAVKDGGDFRLTGRKTWITNAPIADLFVIWAREDGGKIRGYLVERGTKGLETFEIKTKLSLHTSVTGEIMLDDVRIPASARLDGASGLKAAFSCLTRARYGIAWGVLGAARSCWRTALEYGLSRRQFGKPLAQNQLYQRKLADMQTRITSAQLAAFRAGQLLDRNQHSPALISLIKRHHCQLALASARDARDMLGGNGIDGSYDVMRHLINLETVNTYEGTEDIHALVLGRGQTGLSAF